MNNNNNKITYKDKEHKTKATYNKDMTMKCHIMRYNNKEKYME